MKGFLILYLFIGMWVAGGAIGEQLKTCPSGQVNSMDMLVTVAIWPAAILAVVIARHELGDAKPKECKP